MLDRRLSGAGQLPADVHAADVDFIVRADSEWLLGGSGIAFPLCALRFDEPADPASDRVVCPRRSVPVRCPAFRAAPPAPGASDTGTPGMAAVHAQLGGLEVLGEIGLPAVRRGDAGVDGRSDQRSARSRLRMLRVAARADERSAIVMFPRKAPEDDVRRLAAQGFIVDSRPGHVRVSPYFYNTPDDHRALLECLAP